jgi:2Fe-2S ferredoxin
MSETIRRLNVTDQGGRDHTLDGLDGWRVMEIIRDHGLPIKAECGGACACATCHVYVDEPWLARLVPASDEEIDKLDEAFEVKPNSRLSCQILMREDLDGLKVTLAPGTEP